MAVRKNTRSAWCPCSFRVSGNCGNTWKKCLATSIAGRAAIVLSTGSMFEVELVAQSVEQDGATLSLAGGFDLSSNRCL